MSKRLAAVLLGLVTRRLLWAWGAVYLAIMACGLIMSASQGGIPAYPDAALFFDQNPSRSELERLLSDGRAAEIEALDCRRGWESASLLRAVRNRPAQEQNAVLQHIRRERELPEFDRFPALRALNLSKCVIFPDDADRLARCRHLEWLSLEGTKFVGADADFLDRLERLETLVAGLGTDEAVWARRRRLPNLRMLVIGEVEPHLQKQALAAFRDSPRLRSVIINYTKLSHESVEILKTLPSLTQVFVSAYAADPQAIAELRGQLPHARVWHAEISNGRISAGVLLVLATTCLILCLAGMVWAPFSIPQARLYPRYMPSNLGVLVCVGIFFVVVQSLIATRFEARFLPAFASAMFVIGVVAAAAATPNSRAPVRPGTARPGGRIAETITVLACTLLALFPVFLMLAGFVVFARHRYLIESYLLGELFWWNVTCLFSALALLGIALAGLPRLAVASNERGSAPALTFADMQQRQQSAAIGWPYAGWERRLARLPKTPIPPTWHWHVQAIRAAGTHTFRTSLTMLVVIIAVISSPHWLIGSAGRRSDPSAAVMLLGMMSMQATQVAVTWWHRRRAFPVHLLFPWSRQEFVKASFCGFGYDVLGTLIAPLLVLPLANAWLRWNLPSDFVVLAAIAFVCVSALASAWLLWVLTFRHRLLATLAVFVGTMLLIGVGMVPVLVKMAAPATVDQSMHATLLAVSTLCVLLATLIVTFAYRRWLRIEWVLITTE